jgi:beta-lactam-binding protein with PASTA domain
MVVVLTLAFLLSATVTIYMLFRIGDTRVPPVVGKGEIEAQKMAEKAGLKVKIQRRGDPKVPENTVIETRPAVNSSVKKDSSVTIVVSSGSSQNKSELRPSELQPGELQPRGGSSGAQTGYLKPLTKPWNEGRAAMDGWG